MSQTKTQQLYRYPGIRSFEREEQDLFFGRGEEIRDLYSQVKVMNLVVLFSKSGIGKSSLLNAGLVPLLELEPFVPIKVRFQDVKVSPVEAVKVALKPFLNTAVLQLHTGQTPETAHFWEYLCACTFTRYGEPAIPIFLLDQFEEFFEHSAEAQKTILLDLADIVSHRLPNRIRDHLLSIPIADRTPEDMVWHQPVAAKFVMAIRSDRLSLLDSLSVEIPLILHNRFHLHPMQRDKARDAIVEPAALPGAGFGTPPFTYAEKTLQLVLDELTNKSMEIEPFQLQLICQYIERQVQRHASGAVIHKFVIDRTFIPDRESIQAILNDYYESAIDTLPEQQRELARDFIETGLIVAGRRVGITEGVEQERYKIGPELLKALIESRLVRVENTHLGRSYEISHDTLVPAILKSYEIRKKRLEQEAAEEARLKREQELEEEIKSRNQAERYEQERRMRLRTRTFATVVSIMALLALTAFIYAYYKAIDYRQAVKDYEKAEKKRQEAVESQKETELLLLKTKVEIYLNARQTILAQHNIDEARKINPATDWIQEKMAEIERINREY